MILIIYSIVNLVFRMSSLGLISHLPRIISSTRSLSSQKLSYDKFDVVVNDITEEELLEIGHAYEMEHLSPGTFSSPPFPVSGRIHGRNSRLMVPLVCQRPGMSNSKSIMVWFLVHTRSPFTCITVKSLEALFGPGNDKHSPCNIAIQDQESNIECQVSKGNFEFVNILGMDAMKKFKLSIDIDWKKNMFKLIQ